MRSLLRLARTLVAHGRLEVDKDRPGDVPSRRRFAEERVEGVVGRRSGGPSRRLALLEEAVGGDSVLQAVQLPALVPRLDAGLAQVNRNAFYQVWSSSNTRGIDSVRSGERTHQRSEQGEPYDDPPNISKIQNVQHTIIKVNDHPPCPSLTQLT
jgi:hypothetical protein